MQSKSSKTKAAGKSAYAIKRASGNQMYGPGCCAHGVTQAQIEKRRAEAKRAGHFRGNVWSSGSEE